MLQAECASTCYMEASLEPVGMSRASESLSEAFILRG